MQKYFLRRLLLIPVTLFLISIIFFAMLRAIPGDTVDALFTDPGTNISEAGLLKLREDLGLTRPIYEQYGVWVWHLMSGDLGFSFHYGQPVSEVLKSRFPRTLEIMILGIVGSLFIGVPLGVLSAYKQDSPLDNAVRVFAISGLTLPSFVLAALFLIFLAKAFNWTPLGAGVGYVEFHENPIENLKIMVFPALVLIIHGAAPYMRLTRSQMLEVIRQDYIRTARSKGLDERVIMVRHALRNSLLPILTLAAVQVSRLIAGAVVVEVVFEVRGLGTAIVEGARQRDYTLLQSLVLLVAMAVLVINLLTDLMYSWVDPRIKYA